MSTAGAQVLSLALVLTCTACLRRDGRNTDCHWPAEPAAQRLDPAQPGYAQHLAADADYAEELAIEHMDAKHGPRSPKFESQVAAGQAKNQCLGVLFTEIGKSHGLPAQEVYRFLGQRNPTVDFAWQLPFLLLSGCAAWLAVNRLLVRYPPQDGLLPAMLFLALGSLAFAAAVVVIGEQWSLSAEMMRVGNGHLSVRANRLPWTQHRGEIAVAAVALFAAVAAFRLRPSR